jgi:hypothetical protein
MLVMRERDAATTTACVCVYLRARAGGCIDIKITPSAGGAGTSLSFGKERASPAEAVIIFL